MDYSSSARPTLPPCLRHFGLVLLCVAVLLGCACAQDSVAVPNLVRFSGTISGEPAGSVGVIFALYKNQAGGAPLWQEVQSVSVDSSGHYLSLLGSGSSAGIPLEVFSSNEARWLGVQAQGQAEQPRVLLVSVPYALKAADAQTLGGLPASAFLRADAATVPASASYVNTATVNTAAAKIATAAALTFTSNAGSIPVFTDGAGTLENSVLSQSGSNIGINTTSPATTLNLVGANPTMRIDNYSNVTGDSPNFNFLSARGVAGAPLPTLLADNLGQFASAGYTGSGFPGSKVKVSFVATENWTPSANGTAMSFQTTGNGTTGRHERMRIDNTGNVGIGDFSSGAGPANPLTVNGIIQSTSGGFKFPDGSTQTTGAPSCGLNQILRWNGTGWVCFTSPAASVLALDGAPNAGVIGTLSSNVLTLGIDPTVVQNRVTGTCTAGMTFSSVNSDGTVTCSPPVTVFVPWQSGTLVYGGGYGLHISLDEAITVTKIVVETQASQPGSGICTPAVIRLGSTSGYSFDLTIGVGFGGYDSGNISVTYPAGAVLAITPVTAGTCESNTTTPPPVPLNYLPGLTGYIRYHSAG